MITPTDEQVEAAMEAHTTAMNNVPMVDCERCVGRGYHHGFGEDGNDPDWCNVCGGGKQVASPDWSEAVPMRAALTAAFSLAAPAGTREAVAKAIHAIDWKSSTEGVAEDFWEIERGLRLEMADAAIAAGAALLPPRPSAALPDRVDAALEAMNGGLIDARQPFHASDRALMQAALDAVSVPLPTQEQAAYALLWRMHTTDKTIHAARHALLAVIGKDGQRAGLDWVRAAFGPHAEPKLEDLP